MTKVFNREFFFCNWVCQNPQAVCYAHIDRILKQKGISFQSEGKHTF